MRAILVSLLVLTLSLLLVVPAMAQTEDELVAKFLKKAEKQQIKKVGYFVVQGSYGKLSDDNDYNKYASNVSPSLFTSTGESAGIDGIYRSKELFAGFGIMTSPKTSALVGFSYWLKLGSTETGDFNLTLVNVNDTENRSDFDLKSQVQVYGLSSAFSYYLLNQPDRYGHLSSLALKTNFSAGYYFASWDVWEGFTGYNLSAAEQSEVQGNLTGSAPGVTLGLSLEYPTPLAGLVLEGSASYLYLNFTSMKWYNSDNEEHVAIYDADLSRVELDLSGPRANFGLKRYFSW